MDDNIHTGLKSLELSTQSLSGMARSAMTDVISSGLERSCMEVLSCLLWSILDEKQQSRGSGRLLKHSNGTEPLGAEPWRAA